jgi:hypothetical protein
MSSSCWNFSSFLFIAESREAMLPKMKAQKSEPKTTTREAKIVYVELTGAISLPIMSRML